MSSVAFRGVLAFPVTPMSEQGDEVVVPAYQDLVDWQVRSGVHGIIALGSTGEFSYLRPHERASIAAATVETVSGRVPAVIGVSSVGTDDAVGYAREARRTGADAILLSLPTYYALTNQEVRQHIAAVAAAADLPVVLYNNPYTSQNDITPDLLETLLDIDSIVAVKEASTDINRIAALVSRFSDRLDILGGGFDAYAFPALCVGATGWTSALANLVPAKCVELYQAIAVDADVKRARDLHYELRPLAGLIADLRLSVAVKAGLRLIGRPVGAPRKPLLPLTTADEEQIRAALQLLGLKDGPS